MKTYLRQLGLFDPSLYNKSITIIGSGGIGSATILGLAKMGINNIKVVDFDIVDNENYANQFFPERPPTLGMPKVEVMKQFIKYFCNVNLDTYCEKYDPLKHGSSIIVSCVDNMKTRQEVFATLNKTPCEYYIDGRMQGNFFQIYSIDPLNKKDLFYYSGHLPNDEDVPDAKCTEKAIIYNVMIVGGIICNYIRMYLTERKPPIYYSIQLTQMNTSCERSE